MIWHPDLSVSAKGVTTVEKERTRRNPVVLIGIGYVSVKSWFSVEIVKYINVDINRYRYKCVYMLRAYKHTLPNSVH